MGHRHLDGLDVSEFGDGISRTRLLGGRPPNLAVAVFAGWLQRLVTSGVFGVLGALYAGVVAFAVTQAPEIVPFDTEWGVAVTFVGAAAVFGASVSGFVLAATDRR